jgi:peptidoglycan biosynthesis protein MviN/MurJ (putative lipid II flippase)
MKRTVDKALRFVLVLSMVAAALVAAMTVPIIRALFERGDFTADNTIGTAEALFFYALAIPIWGGLQILNRAFYARREMWTPVLVGTAATIAAVPLYVILQNTFGLRGVALASTLALGIYTGILAAVWYGEPTDTARLRVVLAQAGRAVPVTVIGGFAAFGVAYGIEQIIDITAFESVTTTIVSVATVVLGTSAFVGIATVIGGFMYNWLYGRQSSDVHKGENLDDGQTSEEAIAGPPQSSPDLG